MGEARPLPVPRTKSGESGEGHCEDCFCQSFETMGTVQCNVLYLSCDSLNKGAIWMTTRTFVSHVLGCPCMLSEGCRIKFGRI